MEEKSTLPVCKRVDLLLVSICTNKKRTPCKTKNFVKAQVLLVRREKFRGRVRARGERQTDMYIDIFLTRVLLDIHR